MVFTAVSYGKLAALYPMAGSAYTYARNAIDSRVGFMVGWVVLLDYFFLPMVVWLIGTAYLTDQFPSVPGFVFLLGFIVLTTGPNIVGIKMATRVNIALWTSPGRSQVTSSDPCSLRPSSWPSSRPASRSRRPVRV